MEKKLIFLGSSVTYGDDGWSMCDFLNEDKRYNVVKWAVSGTTLCDISEESYVCRLNRNIDAEDKCDCFVCQLSTNDAARDLEIGNIALSEDVSDFDTSTIVGAIEYIVAKAKKKWNRPIIFYTNIYMQESKYEKMVETLLELKEKWNFEIVDLWNDPDMRNVSSEVYNKYMKDKIHPNRLGYREWWGPKFAEKLEDVFAE